MKHAYLTALALALGTTVASAADLPARTEPLAPVTPSLPIFTWTGFYVGANAGYAFGSDSRQRFIGNPVLVNTLVPAGVVPSGLDTDGDGFTGGVQAGFNYQIGQFVVGVEGDINYIDVDRSRTFSSPALGGTVTEFKSELDYLATLRARLGFAVDRLLVYGTGGFAFGEVGYSGSITAPGLLWSGSSSDTRVGYALGGGLEYAFTNNITAKVEYLYYDLGRQNYTLAAQTAAAANTGAFGSVRGETKGSIVRAGLNFKF